jgi:hypothetical protein
MADVRVMSPSPMAAYGSRIASTFAAESSAVVTTQLRGETFALTRIRRSRPQPERTAPLVSTRG